MEIYEAAKLGNIEKIKYFIEEECVNINKQIDVQKLLYIAVENNHEELTKFLLTKQADPNEGPKNALTPLVLAARDGNERCVEILLKNGAEPNKPIRVVRKSFLSTNEDNYDLTPLLLAVQRGNERCVEILLNYGANPNESGGLVSMT